nr:MAG TPA: 24-sterol C-methyltransferase [Caudoviricetes sp.]DAK91492.1 MAG TPA: 24-sterol C-methyltransferase [Caudoviricetes sp.]DAQ35787.1 MAG TPA: 24-sterol C-methyltransferase [Caudoviricetes sp.]
MIKKSYTVLPCPKCGSGLIAWGKKIKSVNPKITVLSAPGTELCCLMCGHYAPTLKQWNSEERKKCT